MGFVTVLPVIRAMDESDPKVISAAFIALGWHKPPALFQRYLAEQEGGQRLAFVAERGGEFAGYVTLLWVSNYSPFAERQLPEISDLNVLPAHRRRGIGTALLDRAESAASARSNVVGLGVGPPHCRTRYRINSATEFTRRTPRSERRVRDPSSVEGDTERAVFARCMPSGAVTPCRVWWQFA